MATLGDSVNRYLQSLVDISVYVYNESQWGLVDLGLGRSLQPRSPKPWRQMSRPWRRQTATFHWYWVFFLLLILVTKKTHFFLKKSSTTFCKNRFTIQNLVRFEWWTKNVFSGLQVWPVEKNTQYKPTWCYVHQSWRKLSFKHKTWFFEFSDGKWHISERCSKLGQIIPEQASQWLIHQLNTMPSHYKLTKVRLRVQKGRYSREDWLWREIARKLDERQAFFGVLPFFLGIFLNS